MANVNPVKEGAIALEMVQSNIAPPELIANLIAQEVFLIVLAAHLRRQLVGQHNQLETAVDVLKEVNFRHLMESLVLLAPQDMLILFGPVIALYALQGIIRIRPMQRPAHNVQVEPILLLGVRV